MSDLPDPNHFADFSSKIHHHQLLYVSLSLLFQRILLHCPYLIVCRETAAKQSNVCTGPFRRIVVTIWYLENRPLNSFSWQTNSVKSFLWYRQVYVPDLQNGALHNSSVRLHHYQPPNVAWLTRYVLLGIYIFLLVQTFWSCDAKHTALNWYG